MYIHSESILSLHMPKQRLFFEKLYYLLSEVENLIAEALQRKHNLGITEYRALRQLEIANNSELRVQELGDQLHLSQSAVSRLVVRLERQNYTNRDICQNDKRGVYIVLTEDGKKILNEINTSYESYFDNAIEHIASCSGEDKKLLDSLIKLSKEEI